jgi:hypothetical protein
MINDLPFVFQLQYYLHIEFCCKAAERFTAKAKRENCMKDFLNGENGDDVNIKNINLKYRELKLENFH